MRGAAPAVIGALAVSVVQIAPHAAPDVFTWILMAANGWSDFAAQCRTSATGG